MTANLIADTIDTLGRVGPPVVGIGAAGLFTMMLKMVWSAYQNAARVEERLRDEFARESERTRARYELDLQRLREEYDASVSRLTVMHEIETRGLINRIARLEEDVKRLRAGET